MLSRLLTPSIRHSRRITPKAFLRLETLEARDCPAAPGVTFQIHELANAQVRLIGTVTDEAPQTTQVSFSGKATATATPDSAGAFSLTTTATGLGTIRAVATDSEGLSSAAVDVAFTSTVPTLTVTSTWLPNRQVRLTGQVTDESPANRTVQFTGVVTGSATTNAQGNFDAVFSVTQPGAVTARVTDQWGQASPEVVEVLTNAAPTIENFTATLLYGRTWRFSGRVVDEGAAGRSVQLSGLPSLAGRTAVIGQDGSFGLTVELGAGETGLARCDYVDMWGLVAQQASFFLTGSDSQSGSLNG